MSNPNDPKPTPPDQPDPAKPEQKPEEGKTGRKSSGGSVFEFKLPDDGSYSDLPPIPQPDAPDGGSSQHAALPPRPTTNRPSSGSFDFIDLGDFDPAALPAPAVQNLPPAPAPAPAVPPILSLSDDAISLPPVAAMPDSGDSSVAYALPVPTSDPSSFTLGSAVLDLANLPTLPPINPTSDVTSVPDISTLYSAADSDSFMLGEVAAPAVPDPSGSFVLPVAQAPASPDASGSFVLPVAAPPASPDSSNLFDLPPLGVAPAALDSSGSLILPPAAEVLPDPDTASTPHLSKVFPPAEVPTADPGSFVGTPAMADLELPMVEPASGVIPSQPSVTATLTPGLESVVGKIGLPPATPTPTPDLESVVGDLGETPVLPASGWLGYSRVRRAEAEEATPAEPVQPAEKPAPVTSPTAEPTGRSSFDFALPEGVKSFSDMPAPQQPDANDSTATHGALPPRPVTNRVDSQTFDMIDLADADEVPGSGVGVSKPPAASAPPASAPLLTPTDGVIHLPPTYGPEAVLGNLEPVDPVAPASGWLDSDVLSIPSADLSALIPTAEPTAEPFDPVPADLVESSDIFSGGRAAPALPVEQSDVIAATAYGTAIPTASEHPADAGEPSRPSEIALTFDGPPGGSTLADGGSGDLPIADEVADSSLLATPVDDTESIHDMPAPMVDPLFDSARLVDTPDLPAAPAVPPQATFNDSADYGTIPVHSADASSILADLNEPTGRPPGADSSSVRVEAPGVDRTLTGSPAEGAFDLTIADEPIPADLFGEQSDATISTDWQSQSGSDLFAEGRTAPEIDLNAESAGTVEPVDADLVGDQPSLTSAPSSIFSDKRPATSGSGSAGSADVRIGHPESPSDLPESEIIEAVPGALSLSEPEMDLADADAAEFTDHPSLSETAEREKGLPPAVPPKSVHKVSSGDFELPAEVPPTPAAPVEDDGGSIDWDAAAILQDDDNATRGIPKDASLSQIMRGLADDSGETPTRDSRALVPAAEEEDDGVPEVTVDWMAGSVEERAVTEAQVQEAKASPAKPKEKSREKEQELERAETKVKPKDRGAKKPAALLETEDSEEKPKSKPARSKAAARKEDTGESEKSKPAKKGGGMLVGLLVGGVLASGAAAGVYLSGVIPNSEKQTAVIPKPPEGGITPADQGQQPPPPTPQVTTNDAGVALASGDIAKALELVKAKAATTTEEKAVAGSVRVFAKVQELGKSNTATAAADDADLKQARADLKAVTDDAEAAKTAAGEKRAVAATVQLGVSYEVAGDAAGARKVFTEGKAKFPKHAAVFEALIDRLDAAEKAPGTSFRMNLTPEDAQRVLFAVTVLLADEPAKAEDEPEPGLFYWKAVNNAAAGKYEDAVKFIGQAKAAHVKRAKALAGRGLNPLTDPLEQMFPRSCDELAAYWKLRDEMYKNPAIAAAIKKDGIAKTLDSLAKTQTELTTAKADLAKLDKEVTTAKEEVAKLDKETKKATADKLAAEVARDQVTADLKAKQKEKDDLLAAIATELKPAKVLPEKWMPADIVAGVKTVAGLASGADAQRVVKAETAAKKAEAVAKDATDKLAVETKNFKEKYDADTAKLKTDHAADLKKLTDDNVAAVKKIKDDNAAELKKAADKFTLDAKKLTDDHLAAVKKLKEDSDAAIKEEQAKTEAEKKAAAVKEISFQKQLANAVTPAQAMDIWLPMLTDLRRVSDADPALAAAARATASAVPDTEDAAKAHTVTGMALFLKGNYAGAKDEFQAAKKNPTYATAKGKAWVKAVDTGLDAIDDPLAPYRQPVVVPPVDLKAAAKSLDVGIAAYKAGKYDAAATALLDAAKNDPSDPVAWYYLGAARWAKGDTKQAEKDISQGAEREKASVVPARVLSAALAPIQGTPRDAIDKARP